MATIVLSAAGAAIGTGVGGGVLGMSSAVIGRAIGAGIGRRIDQRLLGGSDPVASGRIDKFRLTGAGEGDGIARLFGRMRIGGHVIWASRFLQTTTTTGGGTKGTGSRATTQYSYSVSLAIALCEGEIGRVGRIWADGVEIAPDDLNLRVYAGSETQQPDPRIEAVEGAGRVPAYRGIAYVVIEDLPLSRFGNRVPQFSFEVDRPAPAAIAAAAGDTGQMIRAAALIPGTGEYGLASTPVYVSDGPGRTRPVNISTPAGRADLAVSLEDMAGSLPKLASVSLVVSWFGDDLRCDRTALRPKVEPGGLDGAGMPWTVSGVNRASAQTVVEDQGRAVYGGTPCDQSVVEAITAIKAAGKEVMFYPFILMEQLAGNGLTDPWTGAAEQPALPWRGRITTSLAAGITGSPDGTAAADAEVQAFFGQADPGDFTVAGSTVAYAGPGEWSYRRMVLHYAHLCAAAGGVEAFCIGSELRGLTRVRSAGGAFPAVAALVQLASDVRSILGAACKIGYAADWSEYFGFQPQDGSGDVYFNLDPLWAHAEIDFVGIDNYMPLADWRDGTDHADAGWGSIYNKDYLKANIEGGEGFDWYYADPSARAAQIRSSLADGAYGEDWVFRYKDIRNWWGALHHERVGGVRQANPTAWLPQSKPIWFTEIGCAAVDKGPNQPNKFVDAKSSESGLPHFSDGRRDELVQFQALAAVHEYWADPNKNPVSSVYGGAMIDMARAHVWAWDARPFPQFPNDVDRWSDGANYYRGHWLNGRIAARSLAGVLSEICVAAGADLPDTDRAYGLVRGYQLPQTGTAREAIQPLLLAYGIDAVEQAGLLRFANRDGREDAILEADQLLDDGGRDAPIQRLRASAGEAIGRVRVGYVDADRSYEPGLAEAVAALPAGAPEDDAEVNLVLTRGTAATMAARWLSEARLATETVRFSLPPSRRDLDAGAVVAIDEGGELIRYRIDRVSQGYGQEIEATRVAPGVYLPADPEDVPPPVERFVPPAPVDALLMDLPMITGAEEPQNPRVAVSAEPWPGEAAVYTAPADSGYALSALIGSPAVVGLSETDLPPARPGLWDRGAALTVRLSSGSLSSRAQDDVLNGVNLAAIGDGTAANWELFQFSDAVLMADGSYALTGRLRGQGGTEQFAAAAWPAGSVVVFLDILPPAIPLPASSRGLARNYRIGPSDRPPSDPVYRHVIETVKGVALRPFSPAHLRAAKQAGGDVQVGWIRRGRVDADSWQGIDIPLGEEAESYLVRVWSGAVLLREATVAQPAWTYGLADQSADGASGPVRIQVAQLSTQFGPGTFSEVSVDV